MPRISVSISNETIARLDRQAGKLGIPRGSMIAGWIGEKLNQLEMTEAAMEKITTPEKLGELFGEMMKFIPSEERSLMMKKAIESPQLENKERE